MRYTEKQDMTELCSVERVSARWFPMISLSDCSAAKPFEGELNDWIYPIHDAADQNIVSMSTDQLRVVIWLGDIVPVVPVNGS
jgi:hypothetical protein